MTTRRQVLVGAGAMMALPGAAMAQDAAHYIPVPITVTSGGTVILQVRINGAGPYPFIMDTGATASEIQVGLARKLALKYTRNESVSAIGGEEIEGVFLADEAEFGPYLRQKGVGFNGMSSFKGGGAGLIAAGFLTRGPSVLDYGAKEIRIYVQGAPDLSDFIPLKPFFLQPDPAASEVIGVHVTIDGISLRLLVDTGADAHVLLYPPVVRGHGLWEKYGPGLQTKSVGASGVVNQTRLVTMPNFALSDIAVPSLPVTLMDPQAHTKANGVDGLLGSRFLELFAMGIANRNVALRPIAQATPAAAASASSAS